MYCLPMTYATHWFNKVDPGPGPCIFSVYLPPVHQVKKPINNPSLVKVAVLEQQNKKCRAQANPGPGLGTCCQINSGNEIFTNFLTRPTLMAYILGLISQSLTH